MPDGIQETHDRVIKSAVPTPPLKLGRYAHFKGNLYVVVGVGKRADQGPDEFFVTYVSEADASVWIRSLADFTAYIDRDKYKGPRFVKVEEGPFSANLLRALRQCCYCGGLVGDDDLEWNETETEPLHRHPCVESYIKEVLG